MGEEEEEEEEEEETREMREVIGAGEREIRTLPPKKGSAEIREIGNLRERGKASPASPARPPRQRRESRGRNKCASVPTVVCLVDEEEIERDRKKSSTPLGGESSPMALPPAGLFSLFLSFLSFVFVLWVSPLLFIFQKQNKNSTPIKNNRAQHISRLSPTL